MIYMGSKRKILKYINPVFNDLKEKHNLVNFFDVFTGGANVISGVNFENRFANDIRSEYINLYKTLSNQELKDKILDKTILTHEEFINYKQLYKEGERNDLITLALSCGTYSGKWNGSYAKRKPDPKLHGRTRNDYGERINALKKQDFTGIVFSSLDYRNIDYSKPNTLFYFDPPYKGTAGYSNEFNHEEFWNFIKEKQKQNITSIFVVSELSAPQEFDVIWEKIKHHGFAKGSKLTKTEKLYIYIPIKNIGLYD